MARAPWLVFKLTLPSHDAAQLLTCEKATIHSVQAQLAHHWPDFMLRVCGHVLPRTAGDTPDRFHIAIVAAREALGVGRDAKV